VLGARPAFAEKDGTANEEGLRNQRRQTRQRPAQQPVNRGNQRGDQQQGRPEARYDNNRRYNRNQRYDRNLRYDRNQGPNDQYGRWDDRGAGPDHQYRRGDRLPPSYRERGYVVDDWRGHNLSAPPRGYHWVQTSADYVLVAIATGIILQLLLGN